jgi:PAS domain S-box-containing protein
MNQTSENKAISFPSYQASEELYQALIDQAADGIFIADPKGRYIEVNRHGCNMLGYTREEILSLSIQDLIPTEDITHEPLQLDELRTGKVLVKERRLRCKDGHLLSVEITAHMLTDGNYLGMVRDISKQKEALEALRTSEERLKLALDAAQMGQWDWDMISGDVVWSPQCLALYGLPPDTDMSYERFLQAVHPEDRERIDSALHRAVEERGSYDELKRTVWPDGSIHWTASRAQVYCNDAGEPIRMVGVTFDASKWREVEEEHHTHLRFLESMDKVNRAMQGTNDLEQMMHDVLDVLLSIFDCDRAGLVYPCDPEAASWQAPMERTRPEYPGVNALGLDIPMDPDVAQTFRTLRASNGPVKFGPGTEYPLPVEISQRFGFQSFIGMALYPKEGKPWVLVLHQCSKPRIWTAEEERLFKAVGQRLTDGLTSLLTYRNLRESERKLTEAEYLAHVGWWDRDFDTDSVTLSDEAYHIFGLPLEERWHNLPKWHARWKELIHPDDYPQVSQAATEALQGGPRYDVKYRVVQPSGDIRFVHSLGNVIRDESGRPRRLFGIMQDITERVQLEEENEQLTSQIYQAQKMESIGRLAGGIAHDFNNLLVPIIGYVDLSLMELAADSKLADNLVQVRKAASQAAKLTQQILAFSRQQVLELHLLDLNRVIEEFKGLLQRLIGEDIELQTLLSPSLDPVKADKGQVEQVLMNLVINSRDAMPEGGRLSIETSNTFLDEAYVEKFAGDLEPGPYVMIAIRDNGQGMDAETQKRIFDPFFTTKETGKGTGLGLATVFGIIKQHQGHIGVYSEPGQGTTFKIYLPKAQDTNQAAEPISKESLSSRGSETVLVVEDDEMVRNLVSETLEAQGYDVVQAKNPADGLELASGKDAIHLLLTDVVMPGMNAKELYKKVATIHPGIKALYMSGYTKDIVDRSVLNGGINFIQKPFTLHELTQKVREVLE